MKQLIEDLISALEYHVEQTRPIHSTTVALQAAREALKSLPPQRTWVGMTDEDFLEACQIAERGNYLVAFQRIQAKLRSKNHEI
jgi:hypothetical protein